MMPWESKPRLKHFSPWARLLPREVEISSFGLCRRRPQAGFDDVCGTSASARKSIVGKHDARIERVKELGVLCASERRSKAVESQLHDVRTRDGRHLT
ncbi:hypothetical protein CUJ84_Chr002945 [Rhizobium leguminosarum]|uniref:Uncharacterized protein n=1 Tax=Rhizobium leguminosarum TaxID=384 RepID=A0A2K9Z531_RHILE|nr:hypothetical protein CUJ84_Chr002945 [Rhizobium leguminosarum]